MGKNFGCWSGGRSFAFTKSLHKRYYLVGGHSGLFRFSEQMTFAVRFGTFASRPHCHLGASEILRKKVASGKGWSLFWKHKVRALLSTHICLSNLDVKKKLSSSHISPFSITFDSYFLLSIFQNVPLRIILVPEPVSKCETLTWIQPQKLLNSFQRQENNLNLFG